MDENENKKSEYEELNGDINGWTMSPDNTVYTDSGTPVMVQE